MTWKPKPGQHVIVYYKQGVRQVPVYHGRVGRVLAAVDRRNVLVEFPDGGTATVPGDCLRKPRRGEDAWEH